tara:strand:+ start:310 stop:780 length:471 start_codon:yes stop_codon:yes gene_type:complete
MTGANDPMLEPVLVNSYEEAKRNQESDVLSELNATRRDLVEAFHTLDRIQNNKHQLFGATRTAYVDSEEWIRTQNDIASSDLGSLDAQKIRTAEYGVKRYHPVTYVKDSEHLVTVIDNDVNKCLETLSHLIAHLNAVDQFHGEFLETKDGENEAPF